MRMGDVLEAESGGRSSEARRRGQASVATPRCRGAAAGLQEGDDHPGSEQLGWREAARLGLAWPRATRSAPCRQNPLHTLIETSQTSSPAGTVTIEEVARQTFTCSVKARV